MGRYDTEEKQPKLFLMIVIAILLAGGGWLYFNRPQQETAVTEVKPLKVPDVPDNAVSEETADDNLVTEQTALDGHVSQDQPVVELPELPSSDQAFREAMLGMSPQLAPWLKSAELIKKFTNIANDFSQGLWLEKHMRFLKQAQPFSVEKTEGGLVISDKSYQRYAALAHAVDSMDVGAVLAVYRKFRPLMLEVFDGFGYPPDRPLEDLFLKSAAQVLAAPVIEEPIFVVRPSVYYKYADQKLEGLSPVAKQMLRMGPKNTRMIQNKVRQLVQELVNFRE